jgi:hypothetical protein
MRIVALLSGGLDSTAMCWHLLTRTDYPLHIHHFELDYHTEQNGGHRTGCERMAVRNVVAWLRDHCRPFASSESRVTLQIDGFPRHPNDHLWIAFMGFNLLNKGLGEVLATGRIATDCNAGGTPRLRSAHAVFRLLSDDPSVREWVPLGAEGRAEKVRFEWVCPIISWTKAEAMMRVPAELLGLTVTCRRPRVVEGAIIECGECRSCRRKAQARACVEAGMGIDEANDWLCRNPPGNGWPAGPDCYDGYQLWPMSIERLEEERRQGSYMFIDGTGGCGCRDMP